MELSTVQQEAVEWISTPTIISAGAGAGKTFALTSKFSHLIKLGYDPKRILCITFTNKASQELKQRLAKMTGLEEFSFRWTKTIHSACLQMLKPYLQEINYRNPITIYSGSDQKKVIKDILSKRKINVKQFLQPVIGIISEAKDTENPTKFLKDYKETLKSTFYFDIVKIFNEYKQKLNECNAIDYDDILWYVHHLLKTNIEFKKHYQKLFQYMLVDEFQDVNNIQFQIVKLLTTNSNLTVVGDDFQSIYGWRGSNPQFFIDFDKSFDKTTLFKFEQNYRSADNIVKLSNDLIKNNENQLKKVCFSTIKSISEPKIVKFKNSYEESKMIARACLKYINSGIDINEIAILYRAKFISRSIERELVNHSIPYTIIGSVAFFERREIKDIVSYLICSLNPNDAVSFERTINIPKRGIGAKAIEKIMNCEGDDYLHRSARCIKNGQLSSKQSVELDKFITFVYGLKKLKPEIAIDKIIEFTNYKDYVEYICDTDDEIEDRFENIKELKSLATKFDNLEEFLEECSLASPEDSSIDTNKKLKLMTIHAAKGLEFKAVFIIGLEDGLFPHWKVLENNDKRSLEEERRLFYVAVTRSSELLNMTYCNERTCTNNKEGSRFLEEIKDHCKFVDLT